MVPDWQRDGDLDTGVDIVRLAGVVFLYQDTHIYIGDCRLTRQTQVILRLEKSVLRGQDVSVMVQGVVQNEVVIEYGECCVYAAGQFAPGSIASPMDAPVWSKFTTDCAP